MLVLGEKATIYLCKDTADLRKGFEGLCALIATDIKESTTENSYFVFINRVRNRMKILYFDVDGLAIWHKRLENGHFPKINQENLVIDRRQLIMLLNGIVPKRLHKRFKM